MEKIQIIDIDSAHKVIKHDGKLPDVSGLPEWEAQDIINSTLLKRVVRAFNTDQETGKVWEPNWNDWDQPKWQLWPDIDANDEHPEGVGFSHSGYDFWYSNSVAGSRLCLRTKKDAQDLYKYFTPLLIKCYLIQKQQ